MTGLLQDIRYAVRQLRKSPGITATAIITLALGIGANTAIFTVLNAVVLRPLPYQNASRLVWITDYLPRLKDSLAGTPDFVNWRNQSHTFTALAAYDDGDFNLTGGPGPERVHFASVTASLLPLLGVQPAIGRSFRDDENRPGSAAVVMLSHEMWQRRFGVDTSIVGTKISLDGAAHEVIGILPASFLFPANGRTPEVLVPMAVPERPDMTTKNIEMANVIGRLRPGVSLDQATAEISTIQHAFVASNYPGGFRNMVSGFETRIVPLQQQLTGDVRRTLFVLLGAVGFLLLIACANTANLQLARATARTQELSVRAALGARGSRLARQLLTESMLLSLSGCVAGVLLAWWAIVAVNHLNPRGLPHFHAVTLTYPVLFFAVGVAMVGGILTGLAPVMLARRGNPGDALKGSSRTATDVGSVRRLRKLLVVAEVSLAVVLLIGSGLFIRSFIGLLQVDPGFEPNNVLTLDISLPPAKYFTLNAQRDFLDRLLPRLSALPGVVQAGAVSQLPFNGYHLAGNVVVEGQPVPPAGMRFSAPIASVTPAYFGAMGIHLLAGRYPDSTDTPESIPVALVSKTFAQHFFDGESPLGKRIQLGGSSRWLTIAGVVADVHHMGLQTPPDPEVYVPFEQSPSPQMAIAVRTSVPPLTLASAVRREVMSLDPEQPTFDIATMNQRLADSIAAQRFNMWLLAVFGAVALALAAVGIYGVISFYVAQRTHEIGIRMALGARREDVLGMVIGRGAILVFSGIALGIGLALALTRFLSEMLFGIRPNDLPTFVSACFVLAAAACLACWLPARRAAKVDPMVALRYE